MIDKIEGFELDCAVMRAVDSGEMHNWFVCMNRGNRIRKDKEYLKKIVKHNKELAKKVRKNDKALKEIVKRKNKK